MRPIPLRVLIRHRWPALLLGLAVLAAASVLSWWLLTGHSGWRADPGATTAARGAGAATDEVLQPPRDDAAAPAGFGETLQEPGRQRAAERVPRPADLLAQLAEREVDPTRQLRGVVQLPDGRPAAGATVTLYEQLSAWPEWRREAIDTAITGTTGRFRFRTAWRPNLLVGFEREDFAGGLVEVSPHAPELELRLQRGFEVQGAVTNDFGRPMAGAVVSLEATAVDDRRLLQSATDGNGRFRFDRVPPGTLRVVARHERWQPAVLPAVVVGVDRQLELRLRRFALELRGKVVAGAGQLPVPGATVYALSPNQQIGRHQPAVAVTDDEGEFTLPGLARGNLRLEVRHPDHATVRRALVVGPSPAPLVVDLPARVRLRGRLVPAGDLPAGLAQVHLAFRSAVDELTRAVVGPDGRFELEDAVTPGLGTLSVPSGVVAFRRSSASAVQLRVEEGQDEVVGLDVVAPAVLVGRVVDEQGRPVAGARLAVTQTELLKGRLLRVSSALLSADLRRFSDQFTRSAGEGPVTLLAVTDDDGRYRVAGLAPGEVAATLSHPGRGSRTLALEVPLPGEVAEVPESVMSRGCRITGRVLRGGRPLAGAQVGVFVGGVAITAITGLDGRYELRDLPPGEYRVGARYATFPTVTADRAVVVEPGRPARVDLTLQRGRIVQGVVQGRDGQPLEGVIVLVRGEYQPVLTDSDGAFRLEAPEDDIELQVVYDDRGTRKVQPVARDVDRVTIRVDAPSNCEVTGRLLGLPGRQPLSGVLLRFSPEGGYGAGLRSRWVELEDGYLRYPWFPAGAWRVTFWSEGYAPHVVDLDLAAGAKHEFGDILLEPGCTLAGRVVDEQGAPVPDALVYLGEESDLDLFQPQRRTGADGSFVVRGVTSDAANLVVRARGYAWRSVALRLPQDVLAKEPLEVRLERGSTIVADLGQTFAAEGGAVVLLQDGKVVATAEVDEDGLAVFPNRSAGDYLVQRFGDERLQAPVRIDSSGQTVTVLLQ